jgi:hypothetical protein
MEKVRATLCALKVQMGNLATMAAIAATSASPSVQTVTAKTAEEIVRACC